LGKYRGELVLLGEQATEQQLPALVINPLGGERKGLQKGDKKGSVSEGVKGCVLWITDTGKAGLFTDHGDLRTGVTRLLDAGYTVIGLDLLYQGEFLSAGGKLAKTRLNLIYPDKVEDRSALWKYFAGYTFGYNRPLFSQRVQDVMATVRILREGPIRAKSLILVGQGREAGPIALAARVAVRLGIDKTVAATEGFRFASVTRFDDPMFVPGAVKYEGLKGLARLVGSELLWLDGSQTVPVEETFIPWLHER
jgi:hypothetical protein